MNDVWLQLSRRRFKPSEAEAITSVSPELQRKWFERHFKDQIPDSFYHWRIDADEGHSRYSWAGVQALGLFKDVLSDLGNTVAPNLFRRGTEGMRDVNDFEFDFRDRESDLFLFYAFERPEYGFSTTTLQHIETVASPVWSSRVYLYNFSALQRRLHDAAADVLKSELAKAGA